MKYHLLGVFFSEINNQNFEDKKILCTVLYNQTFEPKIARVLDLDPKLRHLQIYISFVNKQESQQACTHRLGDETQRVSSVLTS